jgi:hypothetical protein
MANVCQKGKKTFKKKVQNRSSALVQNRNNKHPADFIYFFAVIDLLYAV